MKKKRKIFLIIFLSIISCAIGVVAANIYQAETIKYTPTDSSWEVNNVNEAINSLYNMKNELDNLKIIGDATAAQILSGQTALVRGNLTTGTMVDNGTWTNTPTSSGKVMIPAGYHNGSGYVDVSTVYTNGVSAGKPTKSQTVSAGCGGDEYETVTCNFTFSKLTQVVGVTGISYSGDDISMAIKGLSISGNRVSFSVKNMKGWSTSITFSVTAKGY